VSTSWTGKPERDIWTKAPAPRDGRRASWSALLAVLAVLALGLSPAVARATTVLNVDLSTTVRPVTHAASGSLYGALETQPADVNGLIAPLHPYMFNNPAADIQQPIGDAIVVAGRVAPVGGKVTVRLADWFPGWPYKFTTMTDWFDKLGQTVSRRKSANLTNIYAYEIWNEPNGTWTSTSIAFNDFWRQTYAQLRQLDPTIKITGPSISYYNQSYLQSFLSYCKTNSCLPDIVGWHELSGGNVTANIQNYRTMEKSLGIGPLPITINEYSGAADLTVEGQPGASASLIAKFERLGVESACISFWDVGHPGRLGSLLATNTDPNGGWWFYKWYGDMAGNMVSTTPPNPADSAALDGFANLDTTGRSASVLFGGTNDGSVQVVIKGLSAGSIFGAMVHVVVEHTPFVSRTTVVKATNVVSTADVAVANNQITVSVSGTNNSDGYRVALTPIGGGAGGTVGSTGGAAGGKGGGGAGGTAGAGIGGSKGGTGGSGQQSGAGGSSATGGSAGGAAGANGKGGGAGSGMVATGGRDGTGGMSAGTAGVSGTGGATGGTDGAGGAAPGSGGTSVPPMQTGDGSGCSCDAGDSSPTAHWKNTGAMLLLSLGLLWSRGGRTPKRRGAGLRSSD
jgi:MYXO-CTERM domain-containing protein